MRKAKQDNASPPGKPKVLFLPRWYPSELDPQLGVFIAKHAQALGSHVEVAVLYPVPDPGQNKGFRELVQVEEGVTTLRVYYAPVSPDSLFHGMTAMLRYFRAALRGWRLLKEQWGKPDMIHVHVLLRPLVLGALLGWRYQLPYLVSEHWTGYVFGFFQKKPGWYKCLSRTLVKRAACLTLVSESLRKAMQANGLINKRTILVPNVVEVDGSCEERSIGKENPIMLTVADLVERNKNVSGILKAMQKLVSDGQVMEYHIIGGGEDQEYLKNMASDMGLLNRLVFFHGRKDNNFVLQFIRKSDFLVTNSNVETFSVATAEALACGKPVIATICGGPEFFVDEQTGILIEPGNQAQLEDAIRFMLAHYQDYDRRILRQSILERFSPDAVGQQFFEIYKTILPMRSNV